MPNQEHPAQGLAAFVGARGCAWCATDSAPKLRRMMAAIHRSSAPEKLAAAALPGWRVHPLKGDLAGFWSFSVTGNWRLIVRFEGNDAFELDFVDYH